MAERTSGLQTGPTGNAPSASPRVTRAELSRTSLLLWAVISILLIGIYQPGQTLFSNDGPLGRLLAQAHHLPQAFTGTWQDLNSLGYREPGAVPNFTYGLRLLLQPVGFSKFYAPLALLVLGLGAWSFFRQLRLTPAACRLGALAAMLNSSFFSVACWGVAAHTLTVGLAFFALAALADTESPRRWLRVALAGFAIGLGVAEGADVGVLFSLYIAAYVLYQAGVANGARVRNLVRGGSRLALVGACAAILAAQSIAVLVDTQIKEVAGPQNTKEQLWNWATQWSLPKREALGLLVPGLFGYRMDTPNGGAYWGAAGRDAAWDSYLAGGKQGPPPAGFLRFTGGGNYVGVPVALVALWAAVQALRRRESVFASTHRRQLWFWLGTGSLALLLAFGRFAPFYRWLFPLPFFSSIRNPAKFLHLFSFALIIAFGYGVDALWRHYVSPGGASPRLRSVGIQAWWSKQSTSWERAWTRGCMLALGATVAGWMVYNACRPRLETYLQGVRFDADTAHAIAAFSIRQVGWFLLFFVLASGFMVLLFSGAFVGRRARWGSILLGLLVVGDLGRANQPWIIYWDYQSKYASNPVIDLVRDRPYEHRVALLPFSVPQPELAVLGELYRNEWLQQLFPYYNIQSLDFADIRRKPQDIAAFEAAFEPKNDADLSRALPRRWQITNTRYFLGPADLLGFLNERVDPACRRFRIAQRFEVVAKPGAAEIASGDQLTAELAPAGRFALYEFTGALPRAKLFTNWLVSSNAQAALAQLAGTAFDPRHTVLVADGVPDASAPAVRDQDPGTVQFIRYAPKSIGLRADVSAPSVLLLNDRFDPNWQVSVDGRQAKLLRCNYLMRGVFLPPGTHSVEFQFRPPVGPLYVSLIGVGMGLLCLGLVLFGRPSTAEILAPAPGTANATRNAEASAAAKPRKRDLRERTAV